MATPWLEEFDALVRRWTRPDGRVDVGAMLVDYEKLTGSGAESFVLTLINWCSKNYGQLVPTEEP